jgi:hypothetical protein
MPLKDYTGCTGNYNHFCAALGRSGGFFRLRQVTGAAGRQK